MSKKLSLLNRDGRREGTGTQDKRRNRMVATKDGSEREKRGKGDNTEKEIEGGRREEKGGRKEIGGIWKERE